MREAWLGWLHEPCASLQKILDRYPGRAFLGDAIATIVTGLGGGTGVTTYAETVRPQSHW